MTTAAQLVKLEAGKYSYRNSFIEKIGQEWVFLYGITIWRFDTLKDAKAWLDERMGA